MSSKKRMTAVALTVAALSLGSIGVASADDKGAAKSAAHAANKAAHDANHAAKEALVVATIGVDAATIKTRRAAGESLAMTPAQATEKKANLTAHVTEKVNAVGGKEMGHKGPKPPKSPKPPKAPRP